MQRFKSIIVSSAVALALTAANLSAQQMPSRPGGTGGGGAGDASASNQSSQIALETKIATSAVGIATGVHAMAQVHSQLATSAVLDAANTVKIATSVAAIATGMNALVQIVPYLDGLEGLVTSGNALLTNIATSSVTIGTGVHSMAAVHAHIATSVVKIALAGASTDTELPAAATPANGTGTPSGPAVYAYNMVHNGVQWIYGQIASSSTGVVDGGTSRVVEASNSPVATSAVQLASKFPDTIIAGSLTAVIATTATNYRQVIAAVTGQSIYVTSELWTVTQAALVSFGYGQGTNCSVSPVDLTGEMSIAASSGASRGTGVGVLYEAPAGNAFCVRIATASAGAAIGGSVRYVRR